MRKPASFYGPRSCPFCGSDQFHFAYNFYPEADFRWKNGTQLCCFGCRAKGPEFLFGGELKDDGEEKAVELWNSRTSDQPTLF